MTKLEQQYQYEQKSISLARENRLLKSKISDLQYDVSQLESKNRYLSAHGEGKKSTRKVLGGAGLGAIVGGIAGGGTGAAIGAIAGGAGGAAMAASGQPHLKIPAETRLVFQLTADWTIR